MVELKQRQEHRPEDPETAEFKDYQNLKNSESDTDTK